MVKRIFNAVILLLMVFSANAQPPESKIAITPFMPKGVSLPQDAQSALMQKMTQMATQNHFGSTSGDFVLTGNYAVIEKQITATIPAQYIIDLEFTFYVVATGEKVIVKQHTQTVRGIARSESKAIISAIRHVNVRTPQIRAFMDSSREKIVDYYSQRVPQLMTKAQSFADRAEFEDALAVLSTIPECVEEYPAVAQMMKDIYTAMVDKFGQIAIQDARSKIAVRQYEEAMNALITVDPMSSYFQDATRLISRVKRTIDAREKAKIEQQLAEAERQRELQIKMHDDEMMLERLKLEVKERTVSKISEMQNDNLTGVGSWLLNHIF